MNISINCHNSIRIEDSQIIYADPYKIDGRPGDADIILIGHSHYDHYSPEDIARVACAGTIIVAPESDREQILEELGPNGSLTGVDAGLGISGRDEDFFQFLKPGDSLEIDDVTIEAVPAYNIGKDFHKKEAGWLGFVVTMGGKRFYIVDDSDNTPEANAVKCDYLFVPAGGKYTMDAAEAAALANSIKPTVAIPTHYGDIVGKIGDGEAFAKLVDGDIEVKLLIK